MTCASLLGVSQSLSSQLLHQDELYNQARFLSTDSWNRVVVGVGNELFAFDGGRLESTAQFATDEVVLDVFCLGGEEEHYILTNQALYAGRAKWDSLDQIRVILQFDIAIARHYVLDDYLVLQSTTNDVVLMKLNGKNMIELPYVGSKIRAAQIEEDMIYLFSDIIHTWNNETGKLAQLEINLPSGKINTLQFQDNIYLITEFGRLTQLKAKQKRLEFMNNLNLRSSIITSYAKRGIAYIVTKNHGLFTYNLLTNRHNSLAFGRQLCAREIKHAYQSASGLWSITSEGLCYSKDKFPVWLDHEMGLLDDHISVIATFQDDLFISGTLTGFIRQHEYHLEALSFPAWVDHPEIIQLQSTKEALLIATTQHGIWSWNREEKMKKIVVFEGHVSSMAAGVNGELYMGTTDRGLWKAVSDSLEGILPLHIFPSQIDRVQDVVLLSNGDLLLCQRNELIFIRESTKKINHLFRTENNLSILNFIVWDGWAYVVTSTVIYRVSLPGLGQKVESIHLESLPGLYQFTNIDHIDESFYISGREGNYCLGPNFMGKRNDKLNAPFYPFSIAKNGTAKFNNKWLAATNKGVVELTNEMIESEQNRLIFRHIFVNDDQLTNETDFTFPADKNTWLFRYQVIAPSGSSIHNYSWELTGNRHRYTGDTEQETIYFPYLPPDEYVLRIDAHHTQVETNSLEFRFQIQPPFSQSALFKMLCLLGGLLSILLLYGVGYRAASQKRSRRATQMKWRGEKLEWEQKALQLQMNPHFIFNALNSIQSLIGRDDKKAKYYIAKLGKLMRMTLQHARAKWINLDDEILILSTYLDVEKLNLSFEYSIDRSAIRDNVAVPPMMLQPLVENAVKHGVHKLRENGQIQIIFTYFGRKINCRIVDNGPGLLPEINGEPHLNLSTKIINERMEHYKNEGIKVDPVTIKNRSSESSSGVEVQIGLPFKSITDAE